MAWKIKPSAVNEPSARSPEMLRKKRTEPSPKRKKEPPTCRLEKSSKPPSVSVVALFKWACAKTSAGAIAYAALLPGHGLYCPRLQTPPLTAPAQMPFAFDQARSPMKIVLLVPS